MVVYSETFDPDTFDGIVRDCWVREFKKIERMSVRKVGANLADDWVQELWVESTLRFMNGKDFSAEAFDKGMWGAVGTATRNVWKKYKDGHPVSHDTIAARNKVVQEVSSESEVSTFAAAAEKLGVGLSLSEMGLSDIGEIVSSTDFRLMEVANASGSLESLVANIQSNEAGAAVLGHVRMLEENKVSADCHKRLYHWLKMEMDDREYIDLSKDKFGLSENDLVELANLWVHPQLWGRYCDLGVNVLTKEFSVTPGKVLKSRLSKEYDVSLKEMVI